ncbi:GNAT family N-acetyltransferase [Marinilabilia salmonicolor]|uniref:GNAT family N-acetyltransferase n=1 Tax=Marinilabilia salmonicolor TaxID=989 RepID=UPI000299D091|nr:GNAT family N-acetyltransferase [Marinilabilia salmonicolor]
MEAPNLSHMHGSINIREIESSEIILLEKFLYDAIFISEGMAKPARSITRKPELAVYIKDFGKSTDYCLVATKKGIPVGAAWSRIFQENEKGFGFVSSGIPELCMSVNQQFRKKGIGTRLLKTLLLHLKKINYHQVSLSVDKKNYAFRMYRKMGFEIVNSDKESATMIKTL